MSRGRLSSHPLKMGEFSRRPIYKLDNIGRCFKRKYPEIDKESHPSMPFNGIYNLRDANESVSLKPWQIQEIKKCAKNPIYFIRNYVYINTKDNGMQLMKTYPFQDKAIMRFLKYRFNINKWSRQVGKSTIVRAYILWYAMFHRDKLVAMLANKLMLAKEQLQLLRESYLALPFWLQPGVKLWNKMSIQFSNGCRIMVAATSGDGIRGFSPNLLYLDEFAFLRPGMADEFMASVMPTISSGKTTRIIITSTPNGMNFFYDMWQNAVDEATATPHELQSKYVRSVVLWNEVPGRDPQWGIDEEARIGEQKFRQEYLCEFVGSATTLIDYKTLQHLHPVPPMKIPGVPKEYSLRVFSPPLAKQLVEKEDWCYVAALDTGFGMRQDYHVLQILLAKTSCRAEQVLVLSSNEVTVEDFCSMAASILRMYGNPPLTIEYNGGSGMTAHKTMFEKLGYDNLINYDKYFRGIYSTNPIKTTAVMLLKLYVQRGYLTLKDEKTINELMSFTKLNQFTWGGGGGNHDDHVTSLYWCVYFMESGWFPGKHEDIQFLDAMEITFAGGEVRNDMTAAVLTGADPVAIKEQQTIAHLEATRPAGEMAPLPG